MPVRITAGTGAFTYAGGSPCPKGDDRAMPTRWGQRVPPETWSRWSTRRRRGNGRLSFLNPTLRREINRKAAKPMAALVMFAGDRCKPGAPMRFCCAG